MAIESILDLIVKAQQCDNASIDKLIKMFYPLIHFYSHSTITKDIEDIESDLTLFLIELIRNKINLATIRKKDNPTLYSYLRQSIYHKFIMLSKNNNIYHKHNILFAELSEYSLQKAEAENAKHDSYFLDDFSNLKKYLTKLELQVIQRFILNRESISDIASSLNVSRQAVNQAKLRALKKLRTAFLWPDSQKAV